MEMDFINCCTWLGQAAVLIFAHNVLLNCDKHFVEHIMHVMKPNISLSQEEAHAKYTAIEIFFFEGAATMKKLQKDFIASRTANIEVIPTLWDIKPSSNKYVKLDLRLCKLESVAKQVAVQFDSKSFNAIFGIKESAEGKKFLANPELILDLDISLNQLESLTHSDLSMFFQLRELNASFNCISNFSGISVCAQLTYLNLSYNSIGRLPVDALQQCKYLIGLNLCSNDISSISDFPVMGNLRQLNLSYNKLSSLNGVQALANLTTVYLQHNNLRNIVNLSACLALRRVNLSCNPLEKSMEVVGVLTHLHKLVELEITKSTEMEDIAEAVKQHTTVTILNGSCLGPLKHNFVGCSDVAPPTSHNLLKEDLKQAVCESMQESSLTEQVHYDAKLHFLHSQIACLIDEFKESTARNKTNTDLWCSYIDRLTDEETHALSVTRLRELAAKPDMLEFVASTKAKKSRFPGAQETSRLLVEAAKALSDQT